MSKYVHFGSRFEFSKWESIKNYDTKPSGGYWGSPVNATFGWESFCKHSDLLQGEPCYFSLKSDSRVLHIHSVSQIKYLPLAGKSETFPWILYLDFEKLSENYDAIEVHFSTLDWRGIVAEDEHLCSALKYWDCDSILVMNPNILVFSNERL